MRTIKFLFLVAAVVLPVIHGMAQGVDRSHIEKTGVVDRLFTSRYTVLASDTSVRDGRYELTYRGMKIEEGQYRNGEKVGEWRYWNLQRKVELRYDYTRRQPTYVLPHMGHKYDQRNYPCIFLGSPLIPFYFITQRIYYPKSEAGSKGGEVVVRLKIDERGRMKGAMIKKSTSKAFADVVTRAVSGIPQDRWRWVPARRDGRNVAGDYDITILFENE